MKKLLFFVFLFLWQLLSKPKKLKRTILLLLVFFSLTVKAQLNAPNPTSPSCGGQQVATPTIQFTWSHVANATHYIIEISGSSLNWNTQHGFPNSSTLKRRAIYGGDTFFVWNDAEPNTTYFYTVQAVNNTTQTNSDFSSPCQFNTTNTPCSLPPPTGVSTNVISPYQIRVSWNSVPNANHYLVYEDDSLIGQTNSTSYNHTGLNPASSYCYEVIACCASSGCSSFSNQICTSTTSNTTYTISGETRKTNGDFIPNAQVTFTGVNGSSNLSSLTSFSDGSYRRTGVSYGWTGNITAQKTGYTFQTISVSNVTSHQPNTHIIGTEIVNDPTVSLAFPNSGTFTVGQTINIDWTSTNQHHWEIDVLEEGVQIGKVQSTVSNQSNTFFNWQIPSTVIDDNGVTHTLNGSNYKIKIVVWNSNGPNADVAFDISTNKISITPVVGNCVYSDTGGLSVEELNAITYLCNEELLDDDGMVEPNDDITRVALAKLGYLSIDLQNNPVADVYPSPFMDLQDETLWYHTYAKNLIYLEYGDGIAPFDKESFNFYPAKTITRGHALKVLLETWNINETQNSGNNPFSDISSPQEAYNYVIKAKDLGIIDNTSSFNPNDNVLRKDVFVWLYRMMDTLGLSVPNPTENDFYITGNYTPYNFSNFDELHSGNFNFYTEFSFDISGIGIPLNFAFTYNSYATDISSDLYPIKPLGFGWSHTYNSYIVEKVKEYTGSNTDRNAIIHFPNGALNVYEHLGSNQYEVITQGVYDELEKVNGGTYRLQTKDQMTYIYEKFTGTPPSFPYVLTSISDRNNNTLNIDYQLGQNGYHRIYKVIGTSGRQLTFTYYSGSDLIKTVTDPLGRTVEFDYDGYNFSYLDQPDLIKYTNAKNDDTFYNYGSTAQERHLLLTITLPKGNTVTNAYERKKLKSTQTNGDQPTTYNISQNYGQIANNNYTETITDIPNTNETIVTRYTKNGTPNYIDKDGIVTANITYDPNETNLPNSVTVNGRTTTYAFDSRGNTLSIAQPMGVSHQFAYNSFNDVTTYNDPNGNSYTNSYDSNGNLQSVTTPRGATSFSVNSRGLVTSITNPEAITTSFTRNAYGDVTGTSSPEGINTSASFDSASRLKSFTNPNGKTITYTLDDNDNLVNEIFNSHPTGYTFDANDNLTHITNANNGVTTLDYDTNDDTLLSVTFEGVTDAYTYLDDGRIATRIKPDNTVFTYNYNSSNGLLESVATSGENVSYTYDSQNNIETVTNQNGSITYSYDALDRVTSTTDYYGNIVEYVYDPNSNITKIKYPNNKEVDYTYYNDNLLYAVKDWNDNETIYTYRDDGLLLTTTYPNGSYETIIYDNAGRPNGMSWKKADGTVINEYTFGNDANGWHTAENKTEQLTPNDLPNENTSYTHNNVNRLLRAGSDSFTYDTNGNTLTGSGNTYTWDKYDRLINVSGTLNASYEYDGNGDRRKSVVNGTSKRFVLDVLGLSKVLIETDNSNNAQNYYVYGLGLISRIDASNNTRYYHYDYRGSTIVMSDENETITHKYEYDDFGKVLQSDEADFNPYRYVGKYGIQYEAENLDFMRARYYNPVVGRFLTEDPIWSTNHYPYAGNDPVNRIDPSGEESVIAKVYAKEFALVSQVYSTVQAGAVDVVAFLLFIDGVGENSSSPTSNGEIAVSIVSGRIFGPIIGRYGGRLLSPTLKLANNKLTAHAFQWGIGKKGTAVTKTQLSKMRNIANNIYESTSTLRKGNWGNPVAGGYRNALFYSNGKDLIVTQSNGTMITILKNAMGNNHFKKARTIWSK